MGLRQKFRDLSTAAKMQLIIVLGYLDLAEEWAEEWVANSAIGRWTPKTRMGQRAQSGAVLTVVVVGIIIIIGILVYSEIQSALPTPSNNDLSNASNNATSTFGDAMELAPVILIVLIASVVLAVVQRFR